MSWTRSAGFHLTLRFLGDIAERQAREVGERLGELAYAQPVPVAFAGPVGFPHLRRPRVLALAVAGPPDLAALADELDRALKGLRLERRDKPFRAHLTLGRVRDFGAPVAEPPAWPAEIPWLAGRVVLFQSFLGPQGSRYEELAAVAFSG